LAEPAPQPGQAEDDEDEESLPPEAVERLLEEIARREAGKE
jgi:hypothetical protein